MVVTRSVGFLLTRVARDDGQEIDQRHRLGEKLHHAQRSRAVSILRGRGATRDEHDWGVTNRSLHRAKGFENRESVSSRQDQVEQHDVGGVLGQLRERLLAIENRPNRIAFSPQGLGEDLAEISIVIDTQNGAGDIPHSGDIVLSEPILEVNSTHLHSPEALECFRSGSSYF